ncbi:MAG: hypothetical protein AAGF12_31815 [Myxococcota bacterium]
MRGHHHDFTHRFLAEFAHRDPQTLLAGLSGVDGNAFLARLWAEHGEGQAETVAVDGLRVVGVDQQAGDRYAIIALPEVLHPGESVYAALVHRPGATRYYVFDRAETNPTQATLSRIEPHGAIVKIETYAATQEALLGALVSQPSAASYGAPGSSPYGAPGSSPYGSPGSLAPTAMAARPSGGGGGGGKTFLAIGGGCLGLIVLFCVGTSFLAYDGGSDFAAEPFSVQTESFINEAGEEAVRIQVAGGPEFANYRITGPNTELAECRYIREGRPCEVALTNAPESDLTYEVTGTGAPSRFFDIPTGDMPESTQSAVVSRPYGFAWSEPRGATICTGATCAIVLEGRQLRLEGAAPGSQLEFGGAVGSAVSVNAFQLADQAGVGQVLTGTPTQRTELRDLRVVLPSGGAVTGTAEVPLGRLRAALISELQEMSEGRSTDSLSEGAGIVWLNNGQVQEVRGEPATVADLGKIFVVTRERMSAGRCGPYVGGIYGYRRIRRYRDDQMVAIVDRSTGRIERRRFRGDLARCPEFISDTQQHVIGAAATGADEFIRERLQSEI